MMFLAWSGHGLWIVGSLVLALWGAAEYCRYVLPPGEPRWLPLAVAFWVAGLFCLLLGAHARQSKPRLVLERQTGRERMQGVIHSLYWIRAEYWGVLYLATGVWRVLSEIR